MRKLALTLGIIFIASMAFAQTGDDYLELARTVLKTEKKATIVEVMQLTEQESEVFWPLYNEYNEKMYTIQSKRVRLIKDYADNYEKLTDLKADELWSNNIAVQQELLNLEKSYYKKFKKILPAGKAARYFQAENKIETLINAELALQIPFIETAE